MLHFLLLLMNRLNTIDFAIFERPVMNVVEILGPVVQS